MPKPYLFMSVKSLLSFSLWLAIGAFLLPACAPLGPSGASSHTWPAHGNQYYNYRDAKYLGSDSAEQLSYRLIDSETFFRAKNKGELIDSSRLITVDNTRIQADLQWIRDSSVITGKEYQIYLFIDRTTGLISSLHGEPGTNHDSHPYIESDRNHGTVSPIPADSPRSSSRILIGQVHGHPARPDGITLHRMSPDDSLTAVCLQAPIYAIDAMDGSQGTPGRIHRANPDPGGDFKGQDHDIGKTWGISGPDADGVFNIGLNALNIWGISHPPNFERLKRIDELYMASQPRHHPDPDLDRGLVNIEGRSVHP
jgi:hypothetical protein